MARLAALTRGGTYGGKLSCLREGCRRGRRSAHALSRFTARIGARLWQAGILQVTTYHIAE